MLEIKKINKGSGTHITFRGREDALKENLTLKEMKVEENFLEITLADMEEKIVQRRYYMPKIGDKYFDVEKGQVLDIATNDDLKKAQNKWVNETVGVAILQILGEDSAENINKELQDKFGENANFKDVLNFLIDKIMPSAKSVKLRAILNFNSKGYTTLRVEWNTPIFENMEVNPSKLVIHPRYDKVTRPQQVPDPEVSNLEDPDNSKSTEAESEF